MHLCTIVWIISSYAQKQPWKDEQVGDMESAWCLQATLRNGENYTNTKSYKESVTSLCDMHAVVTFFERLS